MIPYIYEISDTERIVSLKDTEGHVISSVQFFTVQEIPRYNKSDFVV